MISTIQKKLAINKALKDIYMRGVSPRLSDIYRLLAIKFAGKTFGEPLFSPILVASNQVVDPAVLKDNAESIQGDIEALFENTKDLLNSESITFGMFSGEMSQLKQRLLKLQEEVDGFLLREYSIGKDILGDDFRDNLNIDLERTTALVSNEGGYATLPTNPSLSSRVQTNNIVISKEEFGPGFVSSGTSFTSVFNDYSDKVWQAVIPEDSFYKVTINLTNKSVIQGHSNEVELNQILIDPITPLYLHIESSNDGFNWTTISNTQVNGKKSITFEAIWALYLRFTIRGIGTVGIRRIELGKVGVVNTALLYSTALTSNFSIYALEFNATQEVPLGAAINHYISTNETGPWQPISPGGVNLRDVSKSSEFFGTSPLIAETTGLYRYDLTTQDTIPESGELYRGINQFKVEAFSFDWAQVGDTYHIPEMSDWDKGLGHIQECYMSKHSSYNVSSIDPTDVVIDKTSFVVDYSNSQQNWWGAAISATTNKVLTKNHNYKLTAYLYSDRAILLDNAGGGLYSTDVAISSGSVGWSLYLNGRRMAYDNVIYHVDTIPGSGALASSDGKTFPLPLREGWNKVELLLYMPTTIGSADGHAVLLLLRPDLLNFQLRPVDQWSYIPKQDEYTLWADGAPLKQVSEFFLKYNVKPLDTGYWSWRLAQPSGTPSGVLLNSNPIVSTNTLDGVFTGSNVQYQIKFSVDYNPTITLYYKAELKQNYPNMPPPKLYSYKFITTYA